ncbi:MAG: AAA family ATPase [Patescibacteria group bacterium]
MAGTEIKVILPSGTEIGGTAPVVFIGPNGAGKTRFGVSVAQKSNGQRIPALRSLAFEQVIPSRASREATSEASSKITRSLTEYFRQADEFNEMLSELMATHADEAIRFREAAREDRLKAEIVPTKLDALLRIWHQTFPGRKLDFTTNEPKVTSALSGTATTPYGAHTMSDGERVAIYLIARVLRAPAGVVVIDEPEVHFHSLLARSFWDTLQAERPDCRFVYVTHDLPFALSRRGAEIGIVKSVSEAEMVDRNSGIPPEIIEDILGAASLSLVAKRLVFSEGVPSASIDSEFYGAWFQSPGTAVVPVGSCRAVLDAVRVFQQKKVVSNAEPLGIVERDYFPEKYLAHLSGTSGIFVLPTQEVEGLLCMRDVAKALALHFGMTETDFDNHYLAFEAEVRSTFVRGRMHKHLMERVKQQIDGQLDGLANGTKLDDDPKVLRTTFVNDLKSKFAGIDAGTTFDEQEMAVNTAIAGPPTEFLKILPGKDCFKILLSNLDISEDIYIDLIGTALRQPAGAEDPTFLKLKNALVAAFTPHLPPR